MKIKFLLFALLVAYGCRQKSREIISPSGKFTIETEVKDAFVMISLFKDQRLLIKENTRAGDFSRWAIGWTTIGDTIVMHSSDIGSKAWIIEQDQLNEIPVSASLQKRATELNMEKYKK